MTFWKGEIYVFHAKKKKILSKQAQLFLSAYMRAVKTQESKAANITHKEHNSPINKLSLGACG